MSRIENAYFACAILAWLLLGAVTYTTYAKYPGPAVWTLRGFMLTAFVAAAILKKKAGVKD